MEIKDGGILIITAPRTGSTNLMKSIGSAYNKKTRMEFNIIDKYPQYNPKEDVLKFIPFWESHISNDNEKIIYDKYDTLIKHAKEFNTIILLDRINRREQIDSYYVLQEHYTGRVNIKWRDEQIDTNSESYKFFEKYLNVFPKLFNKLSKDLNIPIDYYEDVYKNKSLTNKNIKLDLEYFKPKYKLRQEIKSKRLV